MPVYDLFSRRQKNLRGEVPEVYVYDNIPDHLRVQIVHIWSNAIGDDGQYNDPFLYDIIGMPDSVSLAYNKIAKILCIEYGFRRLPGEKNPSNKYQEVVGFFLREKNVERVLDVVELSFQVIDEATRSFDYMGRDDASEIADDAIDELNIRFREHGVGFQFLGGQIVRVDSEYVHSEATKPAIRLLRQKHYTGAQQEFLNAHQHYRKGETKEALNNCLKALESLMKAICDKRRWSYPRNATASALVDVCLKNELIPSFWQSQYSGLRTLLESGVPTGRNKLSGHGQGTEPVEVPGHIAAYMLHMTASAIVFLAEAEAQLK